MQTPAILLLSAALSGSPGADATTEPRDLDAPPASATPAERALWRRAREANDRVVTERARATGLQLRAKRVLERLRAPARDGALDGARARHLEREVEDAWRENSALMIGPWPVDPTRACRYELLHHDGALRLEGGRRREAEVESTRAALEECLRRADAVLAKAGAVNRELEEEVGEAERALGGAAAAAAAGRAP